MFTFYCLIIESPNQTKKWSALLVNNIKVISEFILDFDNLQKGQTTFRGQFLLACIGGHKNDRAYLFFIYGFNISLNKADYSAIGAELWMFL